MPAGFPSVNEVAGEQEDLRPLFFRVPEQCVRKLRIIDRFRVFPAFVRVIRIEVEIRGDRDPKPFGSWHWGNSGTRHILRGLLSCRPAEEKGCERA